jgi:hypothetical protein
VSCQKEPSCKQCRVNKGGGGASALMAPRGEHTRDASSCSKTEPCVGMSGSVFNRGRESNRVGRGAVHHCVSPRAAERRGDWVFGGRAADTERRSFGAHRPHASRSQQHTGYEEPSSTRRGCKTQEAEIGHRAREASSPSTRGPYQYGRAASTVSRKGAVKRREDAKALKRA